MGRRLTPRQLADRALTEKQYQQQIMDLARLRGWMVGHWADSRRQVRPGVFVGDPDSKGVPDLLMAHPKHGVAFVEVKKELGKVSPEQDEWLDRLLDAGAPAVVSRPSGWEDMDEWLALGFPPAEVCRGLPRGRPV